MLHVKPKKSKSGFKVKVHAQPETSKKNRVVHEVFVGTRTLALFLGFTIGGVMVGRSFWEYGILHLGLDATTVVGVLLFVTTGLILHKFRRA